jgi:hypothetical protein
MLARERTGYRRRLLTAQPTEGGMRSPGLGRLHNDPRILFVRRTIAFACVAPTTKKAFGIKWIAEVFSSLSSGRANNWGLYR